MPWRLMTAAAGVVVCHSLAELPLYAAAAALELAAG